jgi:hypothetical protein
VRLAGSGWTVKDQVSVSLDKLAVEVLKQLGFWQLRLQREIERLDRLERWKTRGCDSGSDPVLVTLVHLKGDEVVQVG